MYSTIVGIFNTPEDTQRSCEELKKLGINPDEISIVKNRRELHDQEAENTVTGSTLGGVAGLVLGMSAIAVPGLGVVAAAGPIAGLLAGAITGGIVGSLIDLGIPESHVAKYENDIAEGKVLLSAPVNDANAEKISEILRICGAVKVDLHK